MATLETLEETVKNLTKRVDALEKENAELKAMMNTATDDVSTLKKKSALLASPASGASITSEAVSDMLSGFIDSFNSKADKKDAPVSYMMSEVEIDLKTMVVMKDNGELLLKPADPGTPENVAAVAPLKLSVKAVPGRNVASKLH